MPQSRPTPLRQPQRQRWPEAIDYHIEPEAQRRLQAIGLDGVDALMHADCGALRSSEQRAELRQLELPAPADDSGRSGATVAYLKRSRGLKCSQLLNLVARGAWPHGDSYREMQLVRQLERSGFAVMRVLAWGERRVAGLVREGFILVEQVPGLPLDERMKQADEHERRVLLGAYGDLLGRLHAAGFFQVVRLKDLITRSADALVLIDRAAAWPWPRRVTRRRCLASLERTARRLASNGHRMPREQVAIIAERYCRSFNAAASGALSIEAVQAALAQLVDDSGGAATVPV